MDAPKTVVARTAGVLRVLAARDPEGASTTEVAAAAGLARPTVHRLLVSLAEEGLVDRDRASGDWLLGPELYLLGSAAAARYDVRTVVQPFVRRLAEVTSESAFYSVRRGEETVCLIREDGAFPIRSHVLHEGARFPLGVVSAGIVVLAFLPEREIDAYLSAVDLVERHGPGHGADEIRARIAQVRERGWSLNPGLIVEGSWGMAAAVFDAGGAPIGALSLTGIEARFSPERRPALGRALLDAAHGLTQRLAQR